MTLFLALLALSTPADAQQLRPWGDRDRDGLTNAYEASIGTNPRRADTDGDGWTDYDEVVYGSNPRDRGQGVDDDGDGLYRIYETDYYFTDPNDPDSDNDGWDDYTEAVYGSDPNDPADVP